jgi:FAD:protein FMN transferase
MCVMIYGKNWYCPMGNRSPSMNLPLELTELRSADWLKYRQVVRYEHRAMATLFGVFLCHPNIPYASQAVQAAWTEVDRLEQELSRFIENSDISRINRVAAREEVKVGLDTYTCLRMCKDLYAETGGAFDITVGVLVDFWRYRRHSYKSANKPDKTFDTHRFNSVALDDGTYSVRIKGEGMKIDLGGFGKGYALDRIAYVLSEWGITCAVLHSGYSTVLSLSAPENENGWPVSLRNPISGEVTRYVALDRSAISASGIRKGAHIIDPGTGQPVRNRMAAWSTAPSAAVADALSTAFMIMRTEQIEKYIKNHSGISACLIPRGESPVLFIGQM